MFNHESEFRTNNFLIMKIIEGALNIKKKKKNLLTIGSLDIVRDWSYAEDIVEAIHTILQEGKEFNYNIASGNHIKLKTSLNLYFHT